jgi:uncharacterized membrane protein YdjX (TVP38/TMEM64 family)
MGKGQTRVKWWIWLPAGLVLMALIAALVLWWRPVYEFVADQEQVRAWVEGLGAWGPIAIYLLEMIQALLAPIPGQAIEAVSGYLYGPWWGVLFPLLGMITGSLIVFLLARRFGRPLVIRLVGKQSMDRLDDLARRGGAPFFFLIWLLPFAPDDLACVAAGLTPMPTRQFLVLMTLGRLPGIFVSVWVGANAAQIKPLWWGILLAGIAVAALILWRWGEQIQESVLNLIEGLSDRVDRG